MLMTENTRKPGPSRLSPPSKHGRMPTHHAAPRQISQDVPTDTAREEFARRLQKAMALKGWSQSDLAREATKQLPGDRKVGKDSVSQYVRALTFPNPEKLQAMAAALGTTPYELMPTRGLRTAGTMEGPLPELDVRETERNMAWVRVNQELPWEVAVKILALIKGQDSN